MSVAALAAVVSLGAPHTTRAAGGEAALIREADAQPGTTDWIIPNPNQSAIAGYTDQLSYLPGDRVTLYVDSGGDPFTYTVYRMGYYQGDGAGLILPESAQIANPAQPPSTISGDVTNGAKLFQTNWGPSASFTTGSNWVSGFYLIVLKNATSGAKSYADFTLRARDPATIVVNFASNTWESYNRYGGLSLYGDTRPTLPPGVARGAAHEVTTLRPWSQGGGSGEFFAYDLPLVEWFEQHDYPVSYATDWDAQHALDTGPNTRLLIMSGHSEYETPGERQYVWGLPDRGVSVAMFGADSWSWQERYYESSGTLVNWRTPQLDPIKTGPTRTLRFEDLGWPQNEFTGAMQVWLAADGTNEAFSQNSWAWNGANVADGSPLPATSLSNNEDDGVIGNTSTPTDLTVLSRQRLAPLSGHFWGDHPSAYQSMTLRNLPNGSFVFNAGVLTFNDDLLFPSLPGISDRDTWIGINRVPNSSIVSTSIERLAGNLISRATGLRNPIPAVARTRHSIWPPLTVITPAAFPVAVGERLVVEYAAAPAGTVVIGVYLDGRRIGNAWPSTGTFTSAIGAVGRTGRHLLELVAYAADGRVLRRTARAFTALPADSKVFHYPNDQVRPVAGVVPLD